MSASAPGYAVKGKPHKTKTGLEIPLEINKGDGDLYGKTINDLIVNVDYETADRLHVKVYSILFNSMAFCNIYTICTLTLTITIIHLYNIIK